MEPRVIVPRSSVLPHLDAPGEVVSLTGVLLPWGWDDEHDEPVGLILACPGELEYLIADSSPFPALSAHLRRHVTLRGYLKPVAGGILELDVHGLEES